MMLRTKLKIRNALRATKFIIIGITALLLIFSIVGNNDYEIYCEQHPAQCQGVTK